MTDEIRIQANLAMIVAMTPNRVIGKDGKMPWHIPEDLKHFKQVTQGHVVIMGRKTYESIGKPLPNRFNIVVSRQENSITFEEKFRSNVTVCTSLGAAITCARRRDAEPIVIGGAELYREAFPLATRLFISDILEEHDGDTFFPEFDTTEWEEVSNHLSERVRFRELTRLERNTSTSRALDEK